MYAKQMLYYYKFLLCINDPSVPLRVHFAISNPIISRFRDEVVRSSEWCPGWSMSHTRKKSLIQKNFIRNIFFQKYLYLKIKISK